MHSSFVTVVKRGCVGETKDSILDCLSEIFFFLQAENISDRLLSKNVCQTSVFPLNKSFSSKYKLHRFDPPVYEK